MKIKMRSHDASTLRMDSWLGMDEWLAELRVDSPAAPPADHRAEADGAGVAHSEALARARAEARALAGVHALAEAEARARVQARAQAEAHAQAEARAAGAASGCAVIGDQLRIPVMWCEMGSCIAWYADRAALGEADTRARAIGAGWCIDALGRLACPSCQQTDPRFWTPRPVVPWDRYVAMVRAARAAATSSRD